MNGMDKILVEGGHKLKGDIKISGSKNAALPILISALLADGESKFSNVPMLDDVHNTISLLASLGASVGLHRNVARVNSSGLDNYKAPHELVHKMRASILVLGPLVTRLKKAKIPLPGGCSIGARPINLHLKALEQLGVKIKLEDGYINAFSKELKGSDIYFDIPTVTGTENLIMSAVLINGVTVLHNAAREPEIVALSQVLNKMGAMIEGMGTSEITIIGVKKLFPIEYSIIPDRIETGTFMVASALTQGDVSILDCMPENLVSVIDKLRLTGTTVDVIGNDIRVQGTDNISCIDLKTSPYPGFPTDLQAPFTTLMSVANGLSIIYETIFENRFIHAYELNRMGADITVVGKSAIIRGVKKSLHAKQVLSNDLRASASLVLAGLVAKGRTEIRGIGHLDRGYESMEKKIEHLGGAIKRVKN